MASKKTTQERILYPVDWLEGRSDKRRTVATVIVAIVALAVGVSSIVGVVRIGDAGAEAVWGRQG